MSVQSIPRIVAVEDRRASSTPRAISDGRTGITARLAPKYAARHAKPRPTFLAHQQVLLDRRRVGYASMPATGLIG
jgi:hypothetical protein